MAQKPIIFADAAALPEQVISLGTMEHNRTGSWRYIRPVYDNKVPPCANRCPAGTDIERFVGLIEAGRATEAWVALKEENPLTRVCGRVCFHPCETACNRGRYDRAVAINALERFAGEHADRARLPGPARAATDKRVAVVGSGPAGLAAAWYLARMGHQVTVFERAAEPGGMLRYGIPHHRLPREVLDEEIDDIRSLGVDIRCDRPIDGRAWAELGGYHAVFLASGAQRSRRLDIPGEDAHGVMSGLDLLRAVNSGRAPAVGARVAVIGGGNSAIDAARVLVRTGARVDIHYRRGRAEMPAFDEEVSEAVREGVTLNLLAAPVRIEVDDGRVSGLTLVRMELGEPDASGRRRPRPVPGSEHTVRVDSVITAVGEVVDGAALPPDLAAGDDGVATDGGGFTGRLHTWAGGDVTPATRTVVDAIGAGKRAAVAIDRELRGLDGEVRTVGRGGAVQLSRYLGAGTTHGSYDDWERVVGFDDLNPAHFTHAERARRPRLPMEQRLRGFGEVVGGLAAAQARVESARCFHCGVCNQCDNCFVFCPDVAIRHRTDGPGYRLDLDYCKGCGICAAECPRGCIKMVEE